MCGLLYDLTKWQSRWYMLECVSWWLTYPVVRRLANCTTGLKPTRTPQTPTGPGEASQDSPQTHKHSHRHGKGRKKMWLCEKVPMSHRTTPTDTKGNKGACIARTVCKRALVVTQQVYGQKGENRRLPRMSQNHPLIDRHLLATSKTTIYKQTISTNLIEQNKKDPKKMDTH